MAHRAPRSAPALAFCGRPLDVFPGSRVRSAARRGVFISRAISNPHDFDRLESAISALVKSHGQLREENATLRRELEESHRRIHTLDSQLLAANQRRQDAYKRIDELIAHLDQLDEHLAEQED